MRGEVTGVHITICRQQITSEIVSYNICWNLTSQMMYTRFESVWLTTTKFKLRQRMLPLIDDTESIKYTRSQIKSLNLSSSEYDTHRN